MDRILITDLLVRCIIGVKDEERREKQDVVINLAISADLHKAGKSDKLENSIDYRALKKKILHRAEESHFYLVEALAEAVAEICLEHPAVVQAQVRVDKPHALRFAENVGVEIIRQRGQ